MNLLGFLVFLSLDVTNGSPLNSQNILLGSSHTLFCPPNDTLPKHSFLAPELYLVNKQNPDKAYGLSKHATISADEFCTITNFNFPPQTKGKKCTLKLLLPTSKQAKHNPSLVFFGEGHTHGFSFVRGKGATNETSWNNLPPFADFSPPALPAVSPGHAYTLMSGPCPEPDDGVYPFLVSGMRCADDDTTFLAIWPSIEKCAIGFYFVHE